MCTVLLPPGGNPIAVKYIYIYISAGLCLLLVTLLASRTVRWLQDFRNVSMYRTASYVGTFVRLVLFPGEQVPPKRWYLSTTWFILLFIISCHLFTQFFLSRGVLVSLSCKIALTQPRFKVRQLSISQTSRVCLIPCMELLISRRMKHNKGIHNCTLLAFLLCTYYFVRTWTGCDYTLALQTNT